MSSYNQSNQSSIGAEDAAAPVVLQTVEVPFASSARLPKESRKSSRYQRPSACHIAPPFSHFSFFLGSSGRSDERKGPKTTAAQTTSFNGL